MSKLSKFSILAICFWLLAMAAFAQTKTRAKVQSFEIGTVENQVFTNRYFNLKLTLPETWQVQEKIIGEIIKDEGKKNMKGKNVATQKAINKQVEKVSVAFTIFKEVAGTPNNANMILAFEDMRAVPSVKNANDYLQLVINTYRSLKLPPDFRYDPIIKTEILGNTQFSYLDMVNGQVKQKMYVIFRKGFAVFFSVSYGHDEDLETMKKVLETGNYKYAAK